MRKEKGGKKGKKKMEERQEEGRRKVESWRRGERKGQRRRQTLISGFLQQKSDRQPFFDYVALQAEKMTQEEFEDLKGRMFRDIEAVKNTHRRQVLPKRSATITRESQKVGILPTTTQQVSSSTQAAAGSSSSSYVYYTPSPTGFENPPSVVTVQDEGSRHNLSGILSQLLDLTTTQII